MIHRPLYRVGGGNKRGGGGELVPGLVLSLVTAGITYSYAHAHMEISRLIGGWGWGGFQIVMVDCVRSYYGFGSACEGCL